MQEQGPHKAARDAATLVSRRTVNLGAAWSVPVIVGAFAAPAAAGSTVVPATPILGSVTAQKGQAVDGNRQVTFYFSFADVKGSYSVVLTALTGGPWATLPTVAVMVTPSAPTASFLLTRPDNNATTHETVTYTVNGITQTATVRIDLHA
ncbi:hypothetical protein [Pedococcus sp. 5OH_020]|uniref:hypothetical protein n=1 Tax=Pedococcus sp. 5OH_020 TaxID=2989814 RepID=UPI0022EA0A0B|nr:hypothetical protein [Pedococcus sp. 5OH_020]